jgi:hypothetical protein
MLKKKSAVLKQWPWNGRGVMKLNHFSTMPQWLFRHFTSVIDGAVLQDREEFAQNF